MFGHYTLIQKSYLLKLFKVLGMRIPFFSSLKTSQTVATVPAHNYTSFPKFKKKYERKVIIFFFSPIRIRLMNPLK